MKYIFLVLSLQVHFSLSLVPSNQPTSVPSSQPTSLPVLTPTSSPIAPTFPPSYSPTELSPTHAPSALLGSTPKHVSNEVRATVIFAVIVFGALLCIGGYYAKKDLDRTGVVHGIRNQSIPISDNTLAGLESSDSDSGLSDSDEEGKKSVVKKSIEMMESSSASVMFHKQKNPLSGGRINKRQMFNRSGFSKLGDSDMIPSRDGEGDEF